MILRLIAGFTAEEFLGGQVLTCNGPGNCRSAFQNSALTLGQMADALLYVGGVDAASPAREKSR